MEDLIMEALGLVITAFIGWLAVLVRRKFDIEIEAKHREALHSALLTGAKLALSKSLTGAAAIQVIKDFAKRSVPDAIEYFDLDKKIVTFDNLAEGKLQEWIGINVDLPIDKIITKDRLAIELKEILGPEAVREMVR